MLSKCPLWRHFPFYNLAEENFSYLFILQFVEALLVYKLQLYKYHRGKKTLLKSECIQQKHERLYGQNNVRCVCIYNTKMLLIARCHHSSKKKRGRGEGGRTKIIGTLKLSRLKSSLEANFHISSKRDINIDQPPTKDRKLH